MSKYFYSFSLPPSTLIFAEAQEQITVHGRIVNESGQPVKNVDVSCFWGANGPGKDVNGKPLDMSVSDNVKKFWGSVGEMSPRDPIPTKSDATGQFTIEIPADHHFLYAIDDSRKLGGIVSVPNNQNRLSVVIKLTKLVSLTGSFVGSLDKKPPYWSHLYVLLPTDDSRPLDSTRIVHCGSFDARFKLRLPAGHYQLQAYSMPAGKQIIDGVSADDLAVDLTDDRDTVDLGEIPLSPNRGDVNSLAEEAKARRPWRDYSQLIGQKPPLLKVTDSKGIAKNIQLADLKGRWVLLYFWGFECVPCLRTGLPKLIEFDEKFAAQKDQFVIMSMCIDVSGRVRSCDDIDSKLKNIVKHLWKNKPISFPLLMDTSFETWESYGLPGYGALLLIDPEGKIVEGDEATLAKILMREPGR